MQTCRFRNSRLDKLKKREKTLKRPPGIALPVTAPIQPFEAQLHDLLVKCPQRPGVSPHPIILIVSSQLRIQGLEKPPCFLVPIESYPDFHPFHCRTEFLAGCPPHDARRPLPVGKPEEFKPEKAETPFQTWMKATKAKNLCFARLHLEIELLQPFWQHREKSLGILLITERADPIIGIPTYHRFALAMWFHHPVKPQV